MNEEKIKELTKTQDTTSEFDPADIEANKILSLFSYIGFLFIIPLICASNSKFAKFHANQGLVLFLFEIVLGVVTSVIAFILGIIPFIGAFISWIIGTVVGLVTLVLAILGIVNAVCGKAKKLPIIGGITIIK